MNYDMSSYFEDPEFKEALAKSKDSGKKLFIDCYTKTCGPCKYMVKFIFPLKECGDYFNSNYVCIMKDMEEGEGIDIAQKYNVRIYPTYLILNHDGTVYCRLDGGSVLSPKEDFVQKVKDAIELAEANRKYAAGERVLGKIYQHSTNSRQKTITKRHERNHDPTRREQTMRTEKLGSNQD